MQATTTHRVVRIAYEDDGFDAYRGEKYVGGAWREDDLWLVHVDGVCAMPAPNEQSAYWKLVHLALLVQ